MVSVEGSAYVNTEIIYLLWIIPLFLYIIGNLTEPLFVKSRTQLRVSAITILKLCTTI